MDLRTKDALKLLTKMPDEKFKEWIKIRKKNGNKARKYRRQITKLEAKISQLKYYIDVIEGRENGNDELEKKLGLISIDVIDFPAGQNQNVTINPDEKSAKKSAGTKKKTAPKATKPTTPAKAKTTVAKKTK